VCPELKGIQHAESLSGIHAGVGDILRAVGSEIRYKNLENSLSEPIFGTGISTMELYAFRDLDR
jgi:hypothetical protein